MDMAMETINNKKKNVLGAIWHNYSFIFVFFIIFIVYALTSSAMTWSASVVLPDDSGP